MRFPIELLLIITIAFLSAYLGRKAAGLGCSECEPCPEVADEWPVSSCAECSEKLGDCLMHFTICETVVEILRQQVVEDAPRSSTNYRMNNDPVFESSQYTTGSLK